jgi:hypothetical protein
MKLTKLLLVVMAACLITLGLSLTSYALHDGGVAHCDACHSMHNSVDGVDNGGGGAYLQVGSDPSSTCLTCHASYGQFSDGSAYRAGGDFYWVTKNYSWTAWGSLHESTGDSHGHNVIAADETGLDADATLATAPGGTYLASQLGCNSCHDPHGKQGNESLLYGDQPTGANYPGGAYIFDNPAPVFLNAGRTKDVTDSDHSAYGSGMSEWCANCHPGFYDTVGKHPSGNNTGAAMNGEATNYNAYVATGDLSGMQGTAYWEIVPFEDGATDTTGLDTGSTMGPNSTANVMCLSCHRAHASAFPNIGKWYFEDTLMLTDSHPKLTDTGATAADVANMYYGRVITAEQRSFCNKCHAQD